MYKGFYGLGSAMLTHQRNLNVIADNITNVSTQGYKQKRYGSTTFGDVLISRWDKEDPKGTPIGRQNYIRTESEIKTDFTQGSPEYTGQPLDFALYGEGFFAVQLTGGSVAYTRMGSFSLDEQGYLCLPGYGRVLSDTAQPLQVFTDKLYASQDGTVCDADGQTLGRIGVFRFDDQAALVHNDDNTFTGTGAQQTDSCQVMNNYLESSNTDLVRTMTEMISVQRSLQSAAELAKMYDQIMTKASTEVGRI